VRHTGTKQELKVAPANYDIWFDYLRLEETNGDIPTVRELYERAIAVVPPAKEKRFWRRYIFLWLNYALFEEVDAKVPRCISCAVRRPERRC